MNSVNKWIESTMRTEKSFRFLISLFIIFVFTSIAISTLPSTFGHTFSQNENSLFLTRVDQMHSQLQLVQNLLSTNTSASINNMNNTKFAQTHAMEAIALLNQKDPATNFTWNQEIAERNQRVARDLTRGLNDLKVSLNQKASTPPNNKSSLADNNSVIQDNIVNLGGLLDEAVSARVLKDAVNNSTNQALVLGNVGNEIFYSYGKAIGFPQAKLTNMVATMNMSSMSSNMNMQGNNMDNMNNMNADGNKNGLATDNKVRILNESEYQNAQAYVKQAQEIVAKYLKSPESATKNATSDIQSQLNKILSQLKMTIDSKGSFSTVMNLIHLQLHPTLISNYKIG
ncbi:MAG: hypothetical protein WBP64_21590 [Nitrososphaeraceae archaeon]